MGAKIIYFLMALGAFIACTDMDTAEESAGAVLASRQHVIFLTEGNVQQTLSVFRQGDSGFTFFETIPVTGGRTEVQLPVGKYRFLFAGSYGENTEMNTPVTGTTLFRDMRFTVLPEEINTGYLRSGDELFLQDEKADSVYDIQGSTTIRVTLKRAVARAIVYIRRGWPTGDGQYTPLPYQNDSIVRYFSKLRLDIGNIGTAVDACCSSEGEGKLSVTMAASDRDSLTPEGFASFTGPFFFPAANQKAVNIKLNLYRSEQSPQPDLGLSAQAVVRRNEQLILNVWVTNDWNYIGVTADTEAIIKETEGEQDVWDDFVVFK